MRADGLTSKGAAGITGAGVATMVIATLQGERDDEGSQAVLDNPSPADPDVVKEEPPSAPDAPGRFDRPPVAQPVPARRHDEGAA